MASSCPRSEVIQQFLLGKLTGREARRVEQHLLSCSPCCSRAEQLSASDELLAALRQGNQQPLQLSPALKRAMQQAKQESLGGETNESQQEDTRHPSQDAARVQTLASRFPEEFALLAPPQQPGEVGRLGHYRVLGVIGSGGMGVVFLAEDTQLQRSVALKVMKPSLAQNPRSKERFLREARAMAAVEHECIVPIYQVGEEGGVPFIAMPLLRGETLQERLRRKKRLPPAEAVRIACQVAAALAAAHRRGLIHRDIKPANIWLEKNGRVRLLDFGLARPLGADSDLTHAGTVLGTPNYMAPEQARGEKLDPRCDLFSLGAVLYHMLSGRKPFGGKTLTAVLAALIQQEPPRLDSVVQGLPRELVLLVHQLLAKDPQLRPQNAAEVFKRIRQLEKQAQHAQVEVQQPSPAGEKPEHTWPTALVPWERGGSRVLPPWPPQRPVAAPGPSLSQLPVSEPRGIPPWLLALGVGAAAVLLGLLLGVFFLRTDKGVIRLEINDPQVEVRIKGTQITLQGLQGSKEIQVTPGEHALVIRRGDFQFETTHLVLRRGQKVTVRIDYLDGQLVVRQGTRELARARVPEEKSEKKPKPDQDDKGDSLPKPLPQPQPTPPVGEGPPGPPPSDASPQPPSPPGTLSQGSQPPVAVAPFGPKAARAYQEAWAKYLGVPVEKEVDLGGGVKMHFVLIPPGEFEMGLAQLLLDRIPPLQPGFHSEYPMHRVRLTRPFYLGKTEVTVSQFARFVEAGGYRTLAERKNQAVVFVGGKKLWDTRAGAHWRNPHFPQNGQHPVTCILREDGTAFCKWLGTTFGLRAELPSEAQWEFACRAGSTRLAYALAPGSLPLEKRGNFLGEQDGYRFTAPVARFPANAFGLHDMLGNVWECCRDDFDPQFYNKSPLRDPICRGATSGNLFRGAAWDLGPLQNRSSVRFFEAASLPVVNRGFRVAVSLDTPSYEPRTDQPPPPGCGAVKVECNVGDPELEIVFRDKGIVLTDEHKLRQVTLEAGSVQVVLRRGRQAWLCKMFSLAAGQQVTLSVEKKEKGQLIVRLGEEVLLEQWVPQCIAMPVPGAKGPPPPVAVAPFGPKAARAYQEAWAKYLGVPVEKEVDLGGGVKMTLVLIPPGEFEMGLPQLHFQEFNLDGHLSAGEQPLHRVQITRPFYIGRTEVTVGQFRRFVDSTQYKTVAEKVNHSAVLRHGGWHLVPGTSWRNPQYRQNDQYPVVCITWSDRQAFCDWLATVVGSSVLLPSEAQWEFACRAGSTGLEYVRTVLTSHWKNGYGKQDGYERTAPVAKFPPNAFGLFDMLGNVWECCRDGLDLKAYEKSPLKDPVMPPRHNRVFRGGAWDGGFPWTRCAKRHPGPKSHHSVNTGMRILLPLDTPSYEPRPDQPPPPGCGTVLVKCAVGDPQLEILVQNKEITLTAEHKLRRITLGAGPVRVVLRRKWQRWLCKGFSLAAGQQVTLTVEIQQQRYLVARLGEQVLLRHTLADRTPLEVPKPQGPPPPVAVAPFGPKLARIYQEAWANYLNVPRQKEVDLGEGVKMQLVLIPPGEYEMGITSLQKTRMRGAPDFHLLSREPLIHVQITRPFYIGRYEVTVAQFRQFVRQTGYRTHRQRNHPPNDNRHWAHPGFRQTPKHPVVWVSPPDLREFCRWLSEKLGYQVCLPSEEMWEFAARAGSTWISPVPRRNRKNRAMGIKVANLGGGVNDGFPKTAPVGIYPPNPFGLYNTLGNVTEWCHTRPENKSFLLVDPAEVSARRGNYNNRGTHLLHWLETARWTYRVDADPNFHWISGFRVVVPLACPRVTALPDQPPPKGCGAVRVVWEAQHPHLELSFEFQRVTLTPENRLQQVTLPEGAYQLKLRQGDKDVATHLLRLRAGERKRLHVRKQGNKFLLEVVK